MGGGWMRQQVEHLHPTTIDERPNGAAELSKEKEGEEEGSSCCLGLLLIGCFQKPIRKEVIVEPSSYSSPSSLSPSYANKEGVASS